MRNPPCSRSRTKIGAVRRLLLVALFAATVVHAQDRPYDIVIRHGTVIDGSGRPRSVADVAIKNGFIAAVGTVPAGTGASEIDATGLFVTPGFINIHSHAVPDALPTAVNMLTQGVTTEIINADGGGPVDLAQQMRTLAGPGLAVNVGGYIGFNSVWQAVVGNTDRRPTPEDVTRMRAMITAGLDQGAWGVSAGLDYKPGYFAKTEEVIKVVDVAKPARTNFTNHDRITPESNFSSKVGIAETVAIGEKSGLVPIVTHMKAQGREQGTAGELLASMAAATKRGHYTAADAYPYLAGQTGLGSLLIPAWAQEGGREAMLKQFSDPASRAKIVAEVEDAMAARFGGPKGVYLPRTQQELTDVMAQMHAGAGETVVRILEQGPDPGAILRFGAEEDLVKILKDPVTSMACDCGASTATRTHPRYYGSFPRVFGRYVREQQIMSWEVAVKKATWLPASTIGMSDRGLIAPGMAADITVFDPKAIIDRATYEEPFLFAEGVRFVLVNGHMALREGTATGAKGGRALTRTANMPSRPADAARARALAVSGTISGAPVSIDVRQGKDDKHGSGTVTVPGVDAALSLGELQSSASWASLTAFGGGHAHVVTIDLADPSHPGRAVVRVDTDGVRAFAGTLPPGSVTLR